MTRLSEKALLVRLSISQWSNTKADKQIADEVANLKQATKSRDRYLQTLISPGWTQLISSIASGTRNRHNTMTLPWQDGGVRILPSERYMEYIQIMNLRKSQFEEEVGVLVRNYPAAVKDAQQIRGQLFNLNDYPSADYIKSCYDMTFTFMPFPDADDFRADLAPEELEKLRETFSKDFIQQIQGAISDLVQDLENRMLKDESDPSEWTKKAARAAQALNLTKDETLENLCRRILGE